MQQVVFHCILIREHFKCHSDSTRHFLYHVTITYIHVCVFFFFYPRGLKSTSEAAFSFQWVFTCPKRIFEHVLISSYNCLIFSCSQSVRASYLKRRTPPKKRTWILTPISICVRFHLISTNSKWTQLQKKITYTFVKET